MITVVSGRIGAGKSLHMVWLIRRAVEQGNCVRTNIYLDYKQVGRSIGRRLRPWQIGPVSEDDDPKSIPIGDRRGHGSRRTLVVLDEALNWFQSTQGKDERKKPWGEWLRQSDKLGQDVFFIAQNFERTAKWIRELAQVSIEIVPFGDLKFLFLRLRWIFPPVRRLYLAISRDVRTGQLLGTRCRAYTSDIWRLYDTSATFGFQAASSAFVGSVPPAFRLPRWPFYALAFFVLVWLILL